MISTARNWFMHALRFVLPCILLEILSCGALALDTITVKSADPRQGSLVEFKKNQFVFDVGKQKPLQFSRIMVESLKMEPPAKVIVTLRGRRTTESYRLAGYQESSFTFTVGDKTQVIPGNQVTSITIGLDFERTRQHVAPVAKKETADLKKVVKPGAVTIVHFHMPHLMASERQGSYVRTIARDSRGRIRLVRVIIENWHSPKLAQYGINALPQFWIYTRNASLSTKLKTRFTTADIDAAVKKAQR